MKPLKLLTEREKQLATVLSNGYNVKSAAFILGIEIRTAYRIREAAMKKLGLESQAQVVAIAIRAQLDAFEIRVT